MKEQLIQKVNNKTKPLGALGRLEDLAIQIGMVQKTASPKLIKPTILVFAGDHGSVKEGISAYSQDVTYQMVLNFCNGGAAINVFCKQHGITLKVIDAGVNHTFQNSLPLIDCKVATGTRNYLEMTAMTKSQLELGMQYGKEVLESIHSCGTNIVGFGEMGIGNTASASLIMSEICNFPIEECVGKGTGLTQGQLSQKVELLKKAKNKHGKIENPLTILQTYGGFEIVQMCSAMQAAYEENMLILVDGFIATAAFLVAHKLCPNIIKNTVFAHVSNEKGHRKMLEYLDTKPILDLEMRLGEGTGCALAYPLIESAICFLNQMASFESANVSKI